MVNVRKIKKKILITVAKAVVKIVNVHTIANTYIIFLRVIVYRKWLKICGVVVNTNRTLTHFVKNLQKC